MSRQTFIQGAIVLMAASFITKVLGFVNRIVMARILGPEGVGLYMMAVPIFALIVTLTRLGLPVAISRLVAQAETNGDFQKIKRILVVSLAITGTLSILFTILTILGAHVISSYFLADERAYYPLLAITPIIPIVAISSVIKGYFQGRQNMKPPAFSQVIEQIVRISLVAFLATLLIPYGLEYAAAGAMISVIVGEAASLIYLFYKFKKGKGTTFRIRRGFMQQIQKGKQTLKDLLYIGLPTTGSGLIGSLSWTFEAIIVTQSLAIAGIATEIATSQYGLLSGYAIPLVMLPMFITHSLSISLVPAVSEAQERKDYRLIHRRMYQAFRIALIFGAPSTVLLYLFAEPMMTIIYSAPEAAPLLQILTPFFIFLYFQGPLQATLQGLGLAKTAMMNTLFGAIVKMVSIFILASRPELGIYGAALAININVCLVTLLHFFSVIKVTKGFTFQLSDLFKVGVALVLMGSGGRYLYEWFGAELQLSMLWTLIFSLTGVGLIYGLALVSMKMIGEQDVRRVPVVGPVIAPFFPRR